MLSLPGGLILFLSSIRHGRPSGMLFCAILTNNLHILSNKNNPFLHAYRYFGVALFHVPCYWLYTMLIKAKNSLLPRLVPDDYVKVELVSLVSP